MRSGIFAHVSLAEFGDSRCGAITRSGARRILAGSNNAPETDSFDRCLFGGHIDAVAPNRHSIVASIPPVLKQIDASALGRYLAPKSPDFRIPKETIARIGLERFDRTLGELPAHV